MGEDGGCELELFEEVVPPTFEQYCRLRELALDRGRTFVFPRTFVEAARSIDELLASGVGSEVDLIVERAGVDGRLVTSGSFVSVRSWEIVGFGSSARWR